MVGGQAYGMDGHMWQGWGMGHRWGMMGHDAGCGVMWQGVEACHKG